jgi:hypothetical protein
VQKGIIAYFVGLVFIIVVALILSGYFGGGGGSGIGKVIAGTTSIPQAQTTATGASTSTSQSTTVPTTSVYFSQCQSKNPTEKILNGNFSTGSYYGWNVSGPGFGNGPFNLTRANQAGGYYGAPWSGYSGTYFATNYGGLSPQAGNLTSKPFEVTEPYLNFRIISAANSQVYVEIIQGKNVSKYWYNTYAASTNTYNNASQQYTKAMATEFENASIPLLNTAFLCQNVSVRVVGGAVGPSMSLDYIAVGDFYLSRTPNYTPGILINQSIG